MNRTRLMAAGLAVASLSLMPGCFTLFATKEVVRGEETRRPIAFENAEAAEVFQRAMRDKSSSLGNVDFSIPFITLYTKERQLSESAFFNECVARCDTNQDGMITLAEAKIFAELKQ